MSCITSDFVPADLDATRWENLEPLYKALIDRKLNCRNCLAALILDRSELDAAASEAEARAFRESLAGPFPDHIAIIMDGNGRWATQRGKPRLFGHHAGAKRVRQIVRACPDIGVKYLTIFAFSTEN